METKEEGQGKNEEEMGLHGASKTDPADRGFRPTNPTASVVSESEQSLWMAGLRSTNPVASGLG